MAQSAFRSSGFMVPFCISWFVWICVHQLVLYYMGMGWFAAITDSIISNTLLIFIALLIFTMLRFYLPGKNGFINLIVWVLLLTVLWFFVNRAIMALVFKSETGVNAHFMETWPVRTAIALLINGFSCLAAYIYYSRNEKAATEKQRAEILAISKEAELYKLRQQLQPHFLFNSLNSINALIGSSPTAARDMLQQLGEFLRATLKKEDQQWVRLQDELHTLQLYLDIEKVRFGNRLSTSIHLQPGTGEAGIPSMLLQPLLENGIKFGLYDTTGATNIALDARLDDGILVVTVENPFDESTATAGNGTGFGLNSVQRRLYLLFGRNDLLKTESKENTFMVTVSIPQQAVKENV